MHETTSFYSLSFCGCEGWRGEYSKLILGRLGSLVFFRTLKFIKLPELATATCHLGYTFIYPRHREELYPTATLIRNIALRNEVYSAVDAHVGTWYQLSLLTATDAPASA